ncbi:MAG: O-antigen ligase family protein [Candidatus Omnitrophica bacterium]|nr:O-antigen ligase family protein [Candidatus Omnitrophota bacterium]
MERKGQLLSIFDSMVYWLIVLLPFSVAIAPGFANTVIGFMIFGFVVKKVILRQRLIYLNQANLAFLFIFLAAILSFKNTVSIDTSFTGILKLLKAFFIFVVCTEEIRDKEHIKKIVFSIIFAASLLSFDAIWQLLLGKDFIHGNPSRRESSTLLLRATGSFPGPNALGIFLSCIVPLIVGLTLFYFRNKRRIIMLFVSLLVIAGLYLTYSRGALIGFFIAFLFLAIMKRNKVIIGALIASVIIFPFVAPKNMKGWLAVAKTNPLIFFLNDDRITAYKNTFNMIVHYPFVGVGVNTYSKVYAKYKLAEAEKMGPTPDSFYAHNNFLQMTGETGLLGLAAFLWFLFVLFKKNFSVFKGIKDEYLKIVSLSLIGCLIAFLINGLTETSLYNARVAMIFWFLTGFSLAISRIREADSNI